MKPFSKILILIFFLCSGAVFAQSYSGKTEWLHLYDLNSASSAYVQSIAVVEGQKVKKGERLISLDESQIALDLEIAIAKVKASEPDFLQAEMDLNRAFELYDRTLLSDVELKKAEFTFAKTKGNYDVAKAQQKKLELLRSQYNIVSPVNGRVLKVHVNAGFYTDTDLAKTLITLVKDDALYAVVNLKVSQWENALIGKKASVKVNTKTYKGVVQTVSLVPQINEKGLTEYPLIVRFKTNDLVPAGMPVTVDIK
ncbi:MAG: efflux RND transporter periplasmic adaptor subunit [Gammaproteobacteria bacterium]|nr:efflux RND transporter periplasmic adaptor subunit [Gammaproteobacteria bacterium]